ncbi:MAG: hypothetical protein FGM42_05690, partial [Ilumatobacteraceae bacterium]|nr:hypothetical protein [Ilumatobacteraceae bacterium]
MIYQHLINNADKHGLLYRPDIVPALTSRSSWARAIRSGVLTLDYPNVARLTSSSRTIHQRIKAAHLACGRDSLIAGPTAAWLHGVSLPEPDDLHVLTKNRLMNAHRYNLVLHRPVQLALIDRTLHDDIPATSPRRTLFDVAAWSPRFLHRTFEHYLTNGDLTVRSTWRSLFEITRQGRPGISRVRNMLNQWSLDTEQPESVLEAKMLSLCFQAGFPPFEFQAQIGPYRVDFLWRAFSNRDCKRSDCSARTWASLITNKARKNNKNLVGLGVNLPSNYIPVFGLNESRAQYIHNAKSFDYAKIAYMNKNQAKLLDSFLENSDQILNPATKKNLLANLSSPAVAKYLKKNKTIILPIGSTEQHGPD